ncbi:DUF3800 domain-containing protein [Desulfitibacter alkalitolerans]|uniref:DUF3800 domain-containing protein n=1 Tax=Desulfitibacter alkalitolerans TaxID=264641 RepID=UPI0012EC7EFF|nr:DUF3800 domain-containing protein [Desulfitibacter alkalitolerans]
MFFRRIINAKIFYIDESGCNGDYVFVAICVENPMIPQNIIKNWRSWMKNRLGKGFHQNEYHDHTASDVERKKVLTLISKNKEIIKCWGIVLKGYGGDHKRKYATAIVELLKHCQITEDDIIIAVDRVEKSSINMNKHIRKVKQMLGMSKLEIGFTESEKEKGIQIADAIAGCISRECFVRPKSPSHFGLIAGLMVKDIKFI